MNQYPIFNGQEYGDWIRLKYCSVIKFSPETALWDKWAAIFRGLDPFNNAFGPTAARSFFEANKEQMLRGTVVLWEANEDYYSLMVQKLQKGDLAFYSEKQNAPREGINLFLDENGVYTWKTENRSEVDLMQEVEKNHVVLGAVDPAYKQGLRNDFSAITSVLLDTKSGAIYVLDAVANQWPYDGLVQNIVGLHKHRKYAKFIVETNGAQRWLLSAEGIRQNLVPVEALDNRETKESRILALFLSIQNGYVRLANRYDALWEQLRNYPHVEHDDLIDSLAMAVSAARNYYLTVTSLERKVEVVKYFMARARGESGAVPPANDKPQKIAGMIQNGNFTDLKKISDTFGFTMPS